MGAILGILLGLGVIAGGGVLIKYGLSFIVMGIGTVLISLGLKRS